FVQDIKVKPNTVYKFTCLAKAEGVNNIDAMGGCISFLNTSVYSDAVYDTNGEWTPITLYGKTANDQTTLSVCARLGGYSFVSSGKAYFKSFSMEEASVSELAENAIIPLSLATFAPVKDSDVSFADDTNQAAPERHTENHVLFAFALLLLCLYALRYVRSRLDVHALQNETTLFHGAAFAVLILAGLILRIVIALRYRGYAVDVTNFEIWGSSFFSAGASFYSQSGLHDYPPLYMLVLGIFDVIRRIFSIAFDSRLHVLFVKLAPIFCDLIFGILLYSLSKNRLGASRARWMLACVVFNPAYIINSAAWGQVDSVLALSIALCLLYAVRGQWHIALPVFAVSMLLKPQALLFGPLGLVAFLFDAFKNRRDKHALIKMGLSLIVSLCILYLAAFPFSVYESKMLGENIFKALISPVSWLISLYSDTTSGYSYITVNALNFYQLFGLNWAMVDAYPFFKGFAWTMMVIAYGVSACIYLFARDKRALPLAGAALISVIFAFGPMMHERYLFPALALLLISYIWYRDRRILYVFIAFTLTQYLNQALVLQCGMVSAYASMGHLSSSEMLLNVALSVVNVLGSLYLVYISFDILIFKRVKALKSIPTLVSDAKSSLEKTSDYKLHLRRIDYILMLSVTLVYAVVAFLNLGSLKAPETFYKNTDYREEIIFDLGETKTFRMTYYGGISPSAFTVSLSNDGENWTEENYAAYSEGDIFMWHWWSPKTQENGTFSNASAPAYASSGEDGHAYVNYPTSNTPFPLQTARYIRLTIEGVGLPLQEVGFWDVQNERLYDVVSVTGSVPGAEYRNLTDEQHTVAFTPSYFNSMYFDEIYHARTAYEFLNRLDVLEWSHPHLGKILIMVGIKIFGMNPFGWRFMGALFGVMMLPAMYLLAKQLTKKTSLSFIAMFLLAVDSMHFTQSRIATVDTYAVFFIMVMYLFMFRYWQMNMNRDSFLKTLVPLGLSGLFFGFACASKWIGLYAGVGLAIIFFTSVWLRFKEYLCARKDAPGTLSENLKDFPLHLVATLLFCVVMFIIVPVIIYFLTYYWHYAPRGQFNVKTVWEMQKQMFSYHNGLGGDTHFFRSPWYEWPLIEKPMWYYSSDTAYLGLGVVSSISCMGNPAVWWTGLVALLLILFFSAWKRRTPKAWLLVLIGFASQFLPWVLVPRSTFIYHYFASVPFIILCTVLALDWLMMRSPRAFRWTSGALLALSLVLFAAFYPLESGLPVSRNYAQ
ncbi:MAG: phospholipid carrier-dependent glycosyltransferase, partial [Clostridia bacterium]|nr:phospholipid carrier-dependent glycosyltransferase [Clostridia bacterium]